MHREVIAHRNSYIIFIYVIDIESVVHATISSQEQHSTINIQLVDQGQASSNKKPPVDNLSMIFDSLQLDKHLILKIYSYLRLSQTVIISRVSSYLFSCYRHLWIDCSYFEMLQTDKLTSQELNKMMQKSRLQHIKQLKLIYQGKNIKKNRQKQCFMDSMYRIKMRLMDGNASRNTMLETFAISPKLKSGVVFIMDSHLSNILNSSYKGLRTIQLHRCPYIKNISQISRCLQLQKFVISYNQYITTESMMPIVKCCLHLKRIQLSQCRNVDENVFKWLRLVEGLEVLGLRMFRQSFGNMVMLKGCQKLQRLDIDDSMITDDQLMLCLRELSSIKYLSIQGCLLLTEISMDYLLQRVQKQDSRLKQVMISRIPTISCSKIQQLQEKLYKISLQIQLM